MLQQVFDATDVANFIDPGAAVRKQFDNKNLLSKDKLDDYNMIVDWRVALGMHTAAIGGHISKQQSQACANNV